MGVVADPSKSPIIMARERLTYIKQSYVTFFLLTDLN